MAYITRANLRFGVVFVCFFIFFACDWQDESKPDYSKLVPDREALFARRLAKALRDYESKKRTPETESRWVNRPYIILDSGYCPLTNGDVWFYHELEVHTRDLIHIPLFDVSAKVDWFVEYDEKDGRVYVRTFRHIEGQGCTASKDIAEERSVADRVAWTFIADALDLRAIAPSGFRFRVYYRAAETTPATEE